MKPDIHPTYVPTTVTCTCGNTFTTHSTAANGEIHTDVCSACHPFYTGTQKLIDTAGRVDRFRKRYEKRVVPGARAAAPAEAAKPAEEKPAS